MSEEPQTAWPVVETRGTPEPAALSDILQLASAAQDSDGNPPLSEQTLVDLRSPDADPDTLSVFTTYANDSGPDTGSGQWLAGVAVLVSETPQDAGVLELVVHPNYRNQGVGTALAAAVQDSVRAVPSAGDGDPRPAAWSHGNHEAAVELAARFGYRPVRDLWKMRLSRSNASLPAAQFPAGVTLRSFEPGRDESAWLEANAAAFAHHPEQGSMSLSDLQARMDEDWFDPAGFLLAVDEEGKILGFHWTKVHPGTGGHPAIGEVYVVGVSPEAQGRGLGKALTVAGIEHLHAAGLDAVMLYVDADNTAAVALYRRLGFVRWDQDVMYAPA
ncbi:mycothiol synthase [Arthrobacter sp. zg-Y769]|uniref:mycothiol synthase n=1 Tax=Arthrobacter sp. zg-Y769 TaxID=2894191 RepID=UPI001E5651D5|nr:mycothiol synthase [Arthrobacter sp. zg-Y769]MCC9203844.1 mycothiol synthase [Arthrobacter sp. zg-Y769]